MLLFFLVMCYIHFSEYDWLLVRLHWYKFLVILPFKSLQVMFIFCCLFSVCFVHLFVYVCLFISFSTMYGE